MYKYQEKIFEEIDNAVDKLETMTEEHYRVNIGFRHTHKVEDKNIPIYVEINGISRFTQQTSQDEWYDNYSRCEVYNFNRIELNKEVFLDLNNLLDKIIKDNKKREKFYKQLEYELESFNKALAIL